MKRWETTEEQKSERKSDTTEREALGSVGVDAIGNSMLLGIIQKSDGYEFIAEVVGHCKIDLTGTQLELKILNI